MRDPSSLGLQPVHLLLPAMLSSPSWWSGAPWPGQPLCWSWRACALVLNPLFAVTNPCPSQVMGPTELARLLAWEESWLLILSGGVNLGICLSFLIWAM